MKIFPCHARATRADIPFVLQLGQKQKELDQLQKQNSVLKEQLESALGREQTAREGYVLQVPSKHLSCRKSVCF